MRLRAGISLKVDPCQGFVPSTVKYQPSPSSNMGSDEECRDVNIRNPMDSCMHRRNPVHTVLRYSYHIVASACIKSFVVAVVYGILIVMCFVFLM